MSEARNAPLTQSRVKELTLRMLEQACDIITGRALGDIAISINATGELASVEFRAWPNERDRQHMILLLAISEEVAAIDNIEARFSLWEDLERQSPG